MFQTDNAFSIRYKPAEMLDEIVDSKRACDLSIRNRPPGCTFKSKFGRSPFLEHNIQWLDRRVIDAVGYRTKQ